MGSPEAELAAGLAALGMEPSEAAGYATDHTPSAQVDWEAAAVALCEAIQAPADKAFRKAADQVYADLLSDVQCFLRDNASFNLGQELASVRREAAEAREQLARVSEALGTHRQGWPCGPTPKECADAAIARVETLKAAEGGVAAAERAALASGLRERADWLRSEYQKGGVRAHLEPRETECRAIADMIERGRFSATEPV